MTEALIEEKMGTMVFDQAMGERIREVIRCQRSIEDWVNVQQDHAEDLGQHWTEDRRSQCALEKRRFEDHHEALRLANVEETISGRTWTLAAHTKRCQDIQAASYRTCVELDTKIRGLVNLAHVRLCLLFFFLIVSTAYSIMV
jgi:hypothetical protein